MDLGSRIQGSKSHRNPDPDPQHWAQIFFIFMNVWMWKEAILIFLETVTLSVQVWA